MVFCPQRSLKSEGSGSAAWLETGEVEMALKEAPVEKPDF